MFNKTSLYLCVLFAALCWALPSSTLEGRSPTPGRVVTYWGIRNDGVTLAEVCADPAYEVVNLAFLDRFFADGGYPSLTLAGMYWPSQAQTARGATSLKDGSVLVDAIRQCQSNGKLVILSLGGAIADVRLASDAQGEEVADTLWNLFGGGSGLEDIRPFGAVKLDGFDFDNESGNPTGYLAMANRFRSNFQQDPSKRYYLTAAPQCPFPDAGQPPDVCQKMDFVWVQFYNNGPCNIAQEGFEQSVRQWSEGIGSAQLYIGGMAMGGTGDTGYVDPETMVSSIKNVQAMGLPNFGGVMLWEARLAKLNGDYHRTVGNAVRGN